MSSLFSLAYSAGHWESNASYNYAYTTIEQSQYYFDARVRLDDGGEIIYSPFAGGVSDFWVGRENQPLVGQEDRLRSRQDRTPFYLDNANANDTPSGERFVESSLNNFSLEKYCWARTIKSSLKSGVIQRGERTLGGYRL